MNRIALMEVLALPGLALLVMGLHSLRRRYGLVPLMVFMAGMVLALQMLSPTAVYFLVGDGRPVAVTSITMVPAVLLGLLFVYIVDGTPAARLTIVAVVSGTVLGTVITELHNVMAGIPDAHNVAGLAASSPALGADLRVMIASALALLAALYAIAFAYQALANRLRKSHTVVATGVALIAGVAMDSIVFHTVVNLGTPRYGAWLIADLAAKTSAGLLLWPFAAIYITRTQPLAGDRRPRRKTFDLLVGEQGATQRALEEAQKARLVSEARYRQLVEQASDGIVLLDTEGVIEEANRRAEAMLGVGADALLHHSLEEYIAPESLAARPLRIPEVLAGDTVITERELLRPEGGRVPVEISARLLGGTHILAIIRDLTERRRAEERLRASEEFHRTILETAYEVTTIVDRAGAIQYQSPAVRRVLGYEPGELDGVSAWDRVHPDDLPAARAAFFRALQQPGVPADVEVRIMSKNKGWRRIAASVTDLQKMTAIGGIVVRYKDITHEHTLREQLQQSQKMESIGRLAGGVAHDFNNLLTAIIGHAVFAETELGVKHPVTQEIRQISAAAERAAGLTQKLLAFASKQVSKPDTVDLRSVVRDVKPMLARVLGEHVEVELDLGDQEMWVRIDPALLEQVLLNLTFNARDAMPGGGRFTLSAGFVPGQNERTEGYEARLTISDTGTGISPDVIEHIFEPFFTTKPAGKGTGLGLATCYGIIKQAGGDIQARPAPGKGSAFDIFLPIVQAPRPPSDAEPVDSARPSHRS